MVLGILSWHTLGPLVPVEQPLNTASDLSIVADHVRPLMTTADQLLLATFSMIMPQISCHLIMEHDIEFTVPPRSPDLSPLEHLWDVLEQETYIIDVQQLHDCIISMCTKI